MTRRLVMLAVRNKHAALWWGRFGLVVLVSRARAVSLTTPAQSGGTGVLRVGPLLFIWGDQ